jgi:hypothetical protein
VIFSTVPTMSAVPATGAGIIQEWSFLHETDVYRFWTVLPDCIHSHPLYALTAGIRFHDPYGLKRW